MRLPEGFNGFTRNYSSALPCSRLHGQGLDIASSLQMWTLGLLSKPTGISLTDGQALGVANCGATERPALASWCATSPSWKSMQNAPQYEWISTGLSKSLL